jgi:hypothetical protein
MKSLPKLDQLPAYLDQYPQTATLALITKPDIIIGFSLTASN